MKKASLPGLTWRIEPAPEERLERLQASSGYRVHVTLPPEMPEGDFSSTVDLLATPAGAAEQPRELELAVQGKVFGRLVFTSTKLNSDEVLCLGAVSGGTAVHDAC